MSERPGSGSRIEERASKVGKAGVSWGRVTMSTIQVNISGGSNWNSSSGKVSPSMNTSIILIRSFRRHFISYTKLMHIDKLRRFAALLTRHVYPLGRRKISPGVKVFPCLPSHESCQYLQQ